MKTSSAKPQCPLQALSSLELEQNLFKLIGQERKLLHTILLYIQEIERRRLYLKTRSSLFEYLVKDMGYSGSSAQRRVEALRLMNELPEVSEQIKSGALHLSQVGELVRAVKQKEYESCSKVSSVQKAELIEAIQNQTHFETQKILAQVLDINVKAREIRKVQKDESIRLEITLSKEQYATLLECRDLASHILLKDGSLEFSEVIGYLSEFYLNKKNSKKAASSLASSAGIDKQVQSASEAAISTRASPVSCQVTDKLAHSVNGDAADKLALSAGRRIDSPALLSGNSDFSEAPVRSTDTVLRSVNKGITSKTRREVRIKFQHCQHVNPRTGEMCQSRFQLEVEHITPRWAHGSNEKGNLTLLCRAHNQERYRRQSGRR